MKKVIFFLLIILAASFTAFTQQSPVKKLHAYSQQSLPGKRPDPGEQIKSSEQYFVYAEVMKGTVIKFTGIWIKNNYYQVKANSIVKTPVTKTVVGKDNKVLVPKSKYSVYQVELAKKQDPSPRPGATLGKHLSTNEVVLVYTCMGKQYFATLAKMEQLESMPMM
jgi:hypothetical protein